MLDVGLRLMLMLFALIAFAGAGAAWAVVRHRRALEGEPDLGMVGVAALLIAFAALCAVVATGPGGVLAFGGVVLWVSYMAAAQRIGYFLIETGPLQAERTEEFRRT